MMSQIRPPVFHMTMDDLNSDAALVKLMDFLEIPPENRVIPDNRVWNTRGELDAKAKEKLRAYPR